MKQTIRRLYQLLIIGSVIMVLLILALANPFIYDTTDFSMVNTNWNGCSTIAIRTVQEGKLQPTFYYESNELTLSFRSFTDYDLPSKNATLVIIGPTTPFTTQEIQYVRTFILEGGMVLLADDFGTGNQLLKGINTTTRLSNQLLVDLSFEKQAPFVNLFTFTNTSSPLFDNVSHLLLNYPTRILLGKNTSVLAETTELSWIDANENGKHDSGEPKGAYPILAIEPLGQGTIVIISDPSLFINSMNQYFDNQQFRDNLFHYLYENRDVVIIDESHRDINTPLQIFYRLPQTLGLELKIGIVILVLLIFLVIFTKIPRQLIHKLINLMNRQPLVEPTTMEQHITEIMEKHPDWDQKKLENLLRRMKK